MARVDLRENEYIEKFVSQEHIDSNDVQFWYQLLSCSFNFMRVQDPRVVEKTLDPYLVRLTLNNSQSFNIGSLLRVFFDRFSRVKSQSTGPNQTTSVSTNPYYLFQSFNALYLIKCITKSYIENSSEEQLIKAFRAQIDHEKNNNQTIEPQQAPLPPKQYQATNNQTQVPQQQTNGLPTIADNAVHNNNNNSIPNDQITQPPQTGDLDGLSKEQQKPIDGPSEPKSVQQKNEFTSGSTIFDQYVATLIAIIVDTPLSDSTYLIQVEAINALLVLLSVQMYSATPANQSIIYKCLMQKKCSIHALILTKTLLNNFVKQDQMPQEAGSIIIGLASGLWKVLTLGYGGGSASGSGTSNGRDSHDGLDDVESMSLLARQSLLLLNILTNHHTQETNPYREAIISCQDSNFNLTDPQTAFENANNNEALAAATTSKSALTSNSIKINFHDLYETICKYLHDDQVALLLYLLLHSNKIFRPYILYGNISTKLDKLILPLLRILYSSIEKGSHHVYMVLIIFIILSEEQIFNNSIHQIIIRGVPWYKDRVLNEITLGSLTALIIVRSFQFNTFRVRDKFLHTNLFATLANLSNHFHNLHPYVCQRIMDLLERLSKRYLAATKSKSSPPTVDFNHRTLDNPLAKALATDTQKQELQDASSIELESVSSTGDCQINISLVEEARQDTELIQEVIRMILEIVNNGLVTQLSANSDLIYTLLYKRDVFKSLLSSHQSFHNMVLNIERVLTYFYNKIEAFDYQLTVEEIKALIREASKEWNYSNQASLLFQYVEDEQPEEFFIPYIWTRIYYSSGIAWNSKRILLFSPDDL